MPWGDRRGPMGMGPMTGRAMGYCAGFGAPGYVQPFPGRGFGPGRGRGLARGFGRGRGRGFGRGRGWGFGPYPWMGPAYPAPAYPGTIPYPAYY